MPDHAVPHPELGGYVLGALEPGETERFEEHLAECADCRAEVGRLSGVRRLLEESAPPVDVPAGLAARTFEAVERAARSERQRVGQRRVVGAVAAAVALIVVTAGTVFGISRLGDPDDGAEREIRLEAATAGHQRGSAYVRQMVSGTRVRLELTRLTPNRSGTYYECWYIGERDRPGHPDRVSAGSFSVGADGTANVTMLTAARFERYPRMAVTLEPADGNPSANGPEVLAPAADRH
jgi:anti-sigma-K factor RskA